MNSALRLNGPAGVGEGAVILADVDAVRADFRGEGRMVVEDEGDAGGTAKRDELAGDALDGGEIVAFGAELEEVGTAGEERGGGAFGLFLGGVAEVEDGVEAGLGEHQATSMVGLTRTGGKAAAESRCSSSHSSITAWSCLATLIGSSPWTPPRKRSGQRPT